MATTTDSGTQTFYRHCLHALPGRRGKGEGGRMKIDRQDYMDYLKHAIATQDYPSILGFKLWIPFQDLMRFR